VRERESKREMMIMIHTSTKSSIGDQRLDKKGDVALGTL